MAVFLTVRYRRYRVYCGPMAKLIDPAVIGNKRGRARATELTAEELSEQGRNAVNERKYLEKQTDTPNVKKKAPKP